MPTLQEYCDWLVDQTPWSVTAKGNVWGRSTKMTSPDGKRRIIEAEIAPQETLEPSAVKRLDHPLSVRSPWSNAAP